MESADRGNIAVNAAGARPPESKLKTYTCKACSREFQALSRSYYCSKQCKITSRPSAKCKICGVLIDNEKYQGRRPRKYCEICRPSQWDAATRKYRTAPQPGSGKCLICGQEFTKEVHHQQLCSSKCQYVWKQKKELERSPECKCEGCGIVFRPKKSDRMRFHSRQCTSAFSKRQSKIRDLAAVLRRFRPCVLCGNKMFATYASRFCSEECRKAQARGRQRSRSQSLHDEVTGLRRCYQCATEFIPSYGSKRRRFCSALCAKRFSRRTRHRKTKARKYGKPTISLTALQTGKYSNGINGYVRSACSRLMRSTKTGSSAVLDYRSYHSAVTRRDSHSRQCTDSAPALQFTETRIVAISA